MRYTILALLAGTLMARPGSAVAQYWVEFSPGTCQVGPPPACVAGHWHQVFVPASHGASGSRTRGSSPEKISEISTDVEFEAFSISQSNVTGHSVGARGMYVRSLTDQVTGGVLLGYERGSFSGADAGDDRTTGVLSGQVYASQDLGALLLPEELALTSGLTASAGLSFSRYGGGQNAPAVNSVGPFAALSFYRTRQSYYYGLGLSYSLMHAGGGDLAETSGALSLGVNGGYSPSAQWQLGGDVFRLEGNLFVLGGTVSRSFTDTFGLTLGLKTLAGMQNFSNVKLTLGSAYRIP